jgi:hypothetical protein
MQKKKPNAEPDQAEQEASSPLEDPALRAAGKLRALLEDPNLPPAVKYRLLGEDLGSFSFPCFAKELC